MEAGLRTRRIWEVDRTWRLYRGLYEVAEVAFVRARSQRTNFEDPPSLPPPYPLPRQSHPGATPASAEAESQNEIQNESQNESLNESQIGLRLV